jgi:hypothetical protein
MMLGAIFGWGILSPLAKAKGWAPGEPGDWETGSRGWTVWISVATLLADCFVKLFWHGGKLAFRYGPLAVGSFWKFFKDREALSRSFHYSQAPQDEVGDFQPETGADAHRAERAHHDQPTHCQTGTPDSSEAIDMTFPSQISISTMLIALIAAMFLCVFAVKFSFGGFMPVWTILIAILLAMLFSIMSVQSVGETDINPVGAIGNFPNPQPHNSFLTPPSQANSPNSSSPS